jgi:hypothetical protein
LTGWLLPTSICYIFFINLPIGVLALPPAVERAYVQAERNFAEEGNEEASGNNVSESSRCWFEKNRPSS